MKKFAIPESATAADPAWVIAYAELFDNGANVALTHFTELKQLIEKLEFDRAFQAGEHSATMKIYEKLGIHSPTEFDALVAKIGDSK